MTGYDDMMNHPPTNHNSVGGPVGGLGPPGMNSRGGRVGDFWVVKQLKDIAICKEIKHIIIF